MITFNLVIEPCSTCSQVYYSVMITYDDHGDNYDENNLNKSRIKVKVAIMIIVY